MQNAYSDLDNSGSDDKRYPAFEQIIPRATEANLAIRALQTFGLEDYVADIEQGVNDAKWTAKEVATFTQSVRPAVKGLAVSSHGFIDYQEPAIFKSCLSVIDCFNPQAYWFTDKPNQKMLDFVRASPATYPLHDPAAYARLCFDRWTALYKKPIILTGQTAPESDLASAGAQAQLARFVAGFSPPAGLVGLNYWHWGATNRAMRDTLAAKSGPF